MDSLQSNKQLYVYDTLDKSQQQIRLFQFSAIKLGYSQDGSAADAHTSEIASTERQPNQAHEIHGTLKTFKLEEAPPFQALSYMWGPAGDDRKIYIDGGSINIRPNLLDFLEVYQHDMRENYVDAFPHFKDYAQCPEEAWLWIDQICIEQQNIQERNHQVALMRNIYSQAQHVISWLGKDDQYSRFILENIRNDVLQNEPGPWCVSDATLEDMVLNQRKGASQHSESSVDLYDEQVSDSTSNHKYTNPYWGRLWIVQEVVLARTVTLLCYTTYVELDNIGTWYQMSDLMTDNNEGLIEFLVNITLIVDLRTMSTRSPSYAADRFSYALEFFTQSDCSDKRDKFYGLLGLLDQQDAVAPDYDKSMARVFSDAVVFFVHLRLKYKSEPNDISVQSLAYELGSLQKGMGLRRGADSAIMYGGRNSLRDYIYSVSLSQGYRLPRSRIHVRGQHKEMIEDESALSRTSNQCLQTDRKGWFVDKWLSTSEPLRRPYIRFL